MSNFFSKHICVLCVCVILKEFFLASQFFQFSLRDCCFGLACLFKTRMQFFYGRFSVFQLKSIWLVCCFVFVDKFDWFISISVWKIESITMSGDQFGQLKKFKLVFLGEQSGESWNLKEKNSVFRKRMRPMEASRFLAWSCKDSSHNSDQPHESC